MEKKVEKDDAEAAASGPSRHRPSKPDGTVGAAEHGQAAIERESRQRGRLKKPRESLHVWIVHFDAERSSGPLASSDET
jgi:hypothetical protein